MVYCYERQHSDEFWVVFYDAKLDEAYTKSVSNLKQITSNGDYCVLASKNDDSTGAVNILLLFHSFKNFSILFNSVTE